MTHYENVFIARQDVSAAQVDALADGFAEIITAGGGTIHRREYWGLKSLAYRIRKNRKGHFVLLNIEATSDTVREMERNMGLSEDVLRHLTIRMDEAPEGPSVMMQGRGERERATRDGDGRPAARSDSPRREDTPGDKKPAGEKVSADDKKPAGEKVSADDKKPAEEKVSADDKKPAEEKVSAGETAPTDDKKPAEAKVSADDKKPAGEKVSADDKKPAEEKVSADDKKPAGEKVSADDKKPAGEKVSAGETAAADDKTPAEEGDEK